MEQLFVVRLASMLEVGTTLIIVHVCVVCLRAPTSRFLFVIFNYKLIFNLRQFQNVNHQAFVNDKILWIGGSS